MSKNLLFLTLCAVSVIATGAPINQVTYASLTGSFVVDFEDLAPGGGSGTNYNSLIVSQGVTFGERFAGQILTANGNFDVLSASATGSLTVLAGVPNQNLSLLTNSGSNVITGLGTLGFPSFDAIGEGSLALEFSNDQSQFGFQLVGGNAGNAFISFFKRDGSLISTLTVANLADSFYGFSREGGLTDIAGISIYNDDPAGIGLDNLKHDIVSTSGVPEPGTLLLLSSGMAALFFRRWFGSKASNH